MPTGPCGVMSRMDGLIMLGVTALMFVGIVLRPLFPGKRRRP